MFESVIEADLTKESEREGSLRWLQRGYGWTRTIDALGPKPRYRRCLLRLSFSRSSVF